MRYSILFDKIITLASHIQRILIFSSSSVAFPEVTVCHPSVPTAYKLQMIYTLKATNVTFSEFLDKITFNLNELITRVEVVTQHRDSVHEQR